MVSTKRLMVLGMLLTFLTGFLSCYAVSSVYIDTEKPFLVGITDDEAQPGDWIKEGKIEILPDKVIIHVKNPSLSRYADTGSMLPVFGDNSNGVRIRPESANQINVGDIITYKVENMLIVHRVIAKGADSTGQYFIVKGDNNNESDGKVYFENVKYVTIALIY